MRWKFLIAAAFFACVSAETRGANQEPPPRGIYLGMTTGPIYFMGASDRRLYGDSWVVGLRAGYDFFPYLGLEAQVRFSGHDTSRQLSEGPDQIPTSFWAIQGLAILRGSYPFTRRLSVSAEVGGGTWYTNPNQNPRLRGSYRLMATGGLGLQYFLRIRSLAMGLDPQLSIVQDLEAPVLQATAYIRYTF
ncbi:MAG: hypothetical protein EA369_06465 [Bradymonadales bacterium]|nr:MAG: hypothetical protein EA369_06465 [Bradymonadales bacterium]